MMSRLDATFDTVMLTLLKYVKLDEYYRTHATFQKFVKYGSWITMEYWLVKGPLTILFTSLFHLWYVLSAFLAGLICTIIGFVLSHYWVWRRDDTV